MHASLPQCLPADEPQRVLLHNEVHARPPARIHLPALVTYVGVSHTDVSREQAWEHLRQLPGQAGLTLEALQGNFLRLRCAGYTLKWERHTEFSRYTIVQNLPEGCGLDAVEPDLLCDLACPAGWLANIPGRTFAAIQLVMVAAAIDAPPAVLSQARSWLGTDLVLASFMGNNAHSIVVTDFQLRPCGFERMLVIAPAGTTQTRAGRIAMRLVELETYRLMALRALPVVKDLAPLLANAERQLADITVQLENKSLSDQSLLDTLVSLAGGVERATAENVYRFTATRAYDTLVAQRIGELREQPIMGTQTLGEFMRRRLLPAMATVSATSQRLASLAERVARTSSLLRTRVDIATELQNQELLAKLTRGQDLQLRLQSTVEGLSIAAISYYVVSLLLYLGKAGKAAGLPINPEMAAGVAIPLVLCAVWWTIRRIHRKLHAGH
jgi:uncharacterized membrane-anchored protein